MTNAALTAVTKVLWRWWRRIARCCRWRDDSAVIADRKRGLSSVIPKKTFLTLRQFCACALLLSVPLWSGAALAATCNSTATGNWNNSAIWSCAAVPGANDDVTVSAGHTVTLNGSNRDSRNFTIAATGQLNDGGDRVNINNNGNVVINGTWNGAGGGRLRKDGTGTLSGGGSITGNTRLEIRGNTTILVGTNLTFTDATNGRIDIDNSIVVTNNGTVTVARVIDGNSASTWTNAANSTLNVLRDLLTNGTLNASAAGNTVNYAGAGQTVKVPSANDYFHLTLSGSGNKDPVNASTYDILGNFTVNAGVTWRGTNPATDPIVNVTGSIINGGTFTTGNGAYTLQGNLTNNDTFTHGTGTFTFTGTAAQTLDGASATTFNTVAIDKASNHVTVACGTPSPTVNTTLTLTSGRIITSGASPTCSTACSAQVPIIVAAAGTIAGGSSTSYVQGALRKLFAAAATLNFRGAGQDEFPVGDASNYTPIEITAGTTSTAGNVTVCVTPTEHPQVTTPPVPTGGVDAARSVNRHWSMTGVTINTTAVPVDATFKFVAGDVDAGASTANFIVERWNGTSWFPTTLAAAGATSTRAQNINLAAGTNDIAIGEPIAGFTGLPGQFNAFDTTTPAGSVIGMIQTKQSGVAFTIRLVRLNAAKNAIDTTYNQAGVTVELYDSSNNGGAMNATTACRATWTAIAGTSQTVTFAAGVVNATFSVAMLANVFRDVRVHVVKTGAGAGEGCSTDRFAIRPQSITVSAHDATWETAGTTRALANTGAGGGNVHKASEAAAATPRPFTLRATPVPAGATNYDGSPTTVSGFPTCGTLCTTVGSLTYTAGSWTAAGSGVRENATAHYSQAGTFNLQLEDAAYAGVDAVDGTSVGTRTVPATATVEVGRFVPDRFEFASPNTPVFLTFGMGSCSPRSFTYVGQRFWFAAPASATLNAVNAAGTVTTNYPLDTATSRPVISETYADSTAPAAAPLNIASVGVPQAASGAGTGTYAPALSGQLSYDRSTTTPVTQFNAAISLTATAIDSTESAVSGNGTISTPTPLVFNGGGSGIAFDSGAAFRYGRLASRNANGSQLVPLPAPLETQYYSGAPANAFFTNTADNCTTLAGTNITMGNFQGSLGPLASCKTNMNAAITFTAGRGNLLLSAPGSANSGSVDLTVQLGTGAFGSTSCVTPGSPPPQATNGANRAYLQGNWTGGNFDQNPTARAAFGVYKGAEEVIFIRENFQ